MSPDDAMQREDYRRAVEETLWATLHGRQLSIEELCRFAVAEAKSGLSAPIDGTASWSQQFFDGIAVETKRAGRYTKPFSSVNAKRSRRNALMRRVAIGDDPTDALWMAHQHAPWLRERDVEGRTALMIAAGLGRVATLEALLPLCDPLLRDQQGKTALMLAAQEGHESCVRALWATNASRKSPRHNVLSLAAERGHAAALRWMIGASSVQQLQEQVGGALYLAVSHRHRECVDALAAVASTADILVVEPLVRNRAWHHQAPVLVAAIERAKLEKSLGMKKTKSGGAAHRAATVQVPVSSCDLGEVPPSLAVENPKAVRLTASSSRSKRL